MRQSIDIFSRHRLFQPEQAQRFERARQGDGGGQVEVTVAINSQVNFKADGFADAFDQTDDMGHLLGADSPIVGIKLAAPGVVDIELDRAIAFGHRFQRLIAEGSRAVFFAEVAIGIETDLIAELAAEQLVDRHAQRLAHDVMQSVIDAGEGEDQRRVARAAITPSPAQLLIDEVDVEWVFADDQVAQSQDGGFGGEAGESGTARVALARAGDAFVGVDADEGPNAAAAIGFLPADDTSLHVGDFHFKSSHIFCPQSEDVGAILVSSAATVAYIFGRPTGAPLRSSLH